ncbi:MAG: N-succinylarginine dihydrolase [Casimicrobiaceae bacterium]
MTARTSTVATESPGRDVGEVNFDGLPGPTHNYSGLASGNLAAMQHARQRADPRAAALQGLAKMRTLAARGWPQAVLPPHERPSMELLRAVGFTGSDADVLGRAARDAPALLAAASSAAAMWAANAATVSGSSDTADGRVHFTPANLAHHLHRAIEAPTTTRILRAIFADPGRFVVHDALPSVPQLGDEGAANHVRLVAADGTRGVDLFVYGREAFHAGAGPTPARFVARQTREASAAIVRRHGLQPASVVIAQQQPDAIDAGAFHNDVVAVGHRHVLFCHARAFLDQAHVLAAVRAAVGPSLVVVSVPEAEVSLDEAVATYLFNSQLLTRADGAMALVAPRECTAHPRVRDYLARLTRGPGPIREVLSLDLRQSMHNGGGPACLRLRVPLDAAARDALAGRVIATPALLDALEAWVRRHYRDRLDPADLADPALLGESRRALDELTTLLELPAVYPFQLTADSTRRVAHGGNQT